MEKTIRSFGRSELAQQYFPKLSAMSAWRKFREWLDFNPRLRSLLSLSRRTYTPAEVRLIYAELGEPWSRPPATKIKSHLFSDKWLSKMLIETLVIQQESLFCKSQILVFSPLQPTDYQYVIRLILTCNLHVDNSTFRQFIYCNRQNIVIRII